MNKPAATQTTTASFCKTFKAGNLAGLTVQETITFATPADAHAWEAGVRRNINRGVLPFELGSVSFSR